VSALTKILDLVDFVFVVTIQGEEERQDQTRKVLEEYGLPFQFFYGSDLRHCSIDQLAAEGVYDPSPKLIEGRPLLTPGEVGCASSHRSLAERVIAGEYKSVLVLEDDMLIISSNLIELEKSLLEIPVDWNLLYLGYNKNNLTMPLSVRLKLQSWYPVRYWLGSKKHNPSTIRRIYRRNYNSHWFRAGCFNGTHAFAIDQSAAQYLVDLQTPIKYEADVALQHLVRFSGLQAYCPRYDIFDQRWDVPSLVGPRKSWG
jgi:glycosyl transferase family 25